MINTTIREIIERIKADKVNLGITLFAPSSLSDITKFEKVRAVKLPDDLITFYSFSNGLESAEDMFRIIPLEEIIDNLKDRDTYTEQQGDFHFAEYMIYCDMWTLHIDSTDHNNYKIYNIADNTITLTNSFSDFMKIFLDGGVFDGLYSWRQAIETQKK